MKSITRYEIKNLIGNWYVLAWGLLFPIIMLQIIPRSFMGDIPEQYRSEAVTGVFIGFSVIIPLAIIFIGFSISLAQEFEMNMLERVQLFGYSNGQIMKSKLVAHFLYLTGALIIFALAGVVSYNLELPTVKGLLIYLAAIYIFSVILFFLAYAIASLIKKTGLVNGVTMFIYFVMLFISGLFGMSVEKLPPFVQSISKLLPTYYMGNDFYKIWTSKPYNYAPFIQSMLLLAAISGLLLLWSFYRDRRKLV